MKEKPVLGSEAVKVLLPFAILYLCKSGVAFLATIKPKIRNLKQPEHDSRIALSMIKPQVEELTCEILVQDSFRINLSIVKIHLYF